MKSRRWSPNDDCLFSILSLAGVPRGMTMRLTVWASLLGFDSKLSNKWAGSLVKNSPASGILKFGLSIYFWRQTLEFAKWLSWDYRLGHITYLVQWPTAIDSELLRGRFSILECIECIEWDLPFTIFIVRRSLRMLPIRLVCKKWFGRLCRLNVSIVHLGELKKSFLSTIVKCIAAKMNN